MFFSTSYLLLAIAFATGASAAPASASRGGSTSSVVGAAYCEICLSAHDLPAELFISSVITNDPSSNEIVAVNIASNGKLVRIFASITCIDLISRLPSVEQC